MLNTANREHQSDTLVVKFTGAWCDTILQLGETTCRCRR